MPRAHLVAIAAAVFALLVVQIATAGTAGSAPGPTATASGGLSSKFKKLKKQVADLQGQVDRLARKPGPPGSTGSDGSPDTPQQVLDKLTQVDGSGSGLDADTIDGFDSPVLAKVVADLSLPDFNFGPIAAGRCGQVSTGGLSGAMPGDFVLATATNGDLPPGGFTFTGAGVQAASNGQARLCNHTAVDATGPTFDIRLVAIRF